MNNKKRKPLEWVGILFLAVVGIVIARIVQVWLREPKGDRSG